MKEKRLSPVGSYFVDWKWFTNRPSGITRANVAKRPDLLYSCEVKSYFVGQEVGLTRAFNTTYADYATSQWVNNAVDDRVLSCAGRGIKPWSKVRVF